MNFTKCYCLLFSVYLLCPLMLKGQEYLPTTSLEHQTINKIINNLSKVSGNGKTPPILQIEKRGSADKKIAYYHQHTHSIHTEIELYELLYKRFGEDRLNDALAIVISHELAHFYQNDISVHDCTSEEEHSQEISFQEINADEQGLYYTFRAGYKTADIAAEVIQVIFEEYDLETTGTCNYPSLKNRLGSIQKAIKKVEEHERIYKLANLLMAVEDYKKALLLFEYIGQSFPTTEVMNNIGVAYAKIGLKMSEDKYVYPLFTEDFTILSYQKKDIDGTYKYNLSTSECYKKAGNAFRRCILLNEEYELAYLNLACVTYLSLEKNTTSKSFYRQYAHTHLESYKMLSSDDEYYNLMKALMYFDDDKDDIAINHLIPLRSSSNPLVKANLEILEATKNVDSSKKEAIIKIVPIDIDDYTPDKENHITIMPRYNYINIDYKQSNQEEEYFISSELDGIVETYLFVKTPNLRSDIKGLSTDEVETKLGTPDKVVFTKEHIIWHYKNSGLLLLFKDNQQESYHYRYRVY